MLSLAPSLAILVVTSALAATPAPEGATAYFLAPSDGAIVTSPVTVKFGLRNMGVAPAGVQLPNTGHHHLLINAEPVPSGQPIPADERHRHFGSGQTEASIELPPGKHTLRLLLGDYLHMPHLPAVLSDPITITVTE